MTAPVVRDMNKMSRMGGVTATIMMSSTRYGLLKLHETRNWRLYTSIGKYQQGRCRELPSKGGHFCVLSGFRVGFPPRIAEIRVAVINDAVVAIIPPGTGSPAEGRDL